MCNRTLIVLTSKYPFGRGEDFLDAEWKKWSIYDDTITISINVTEEESQSVRKIGNSEKHIQSLYFDCSNIKDHFFPKLFFICRDLFSVTAIHDLLMLLKTRDLNATTLKSLFRFTVYSGISKCFLHQNASVFQEIENADIYAYWSYLQPVLGIYLSKRIKKSTVVSRAHGFDLYNERHPGNFIPYRDYVFQNVDSVYAVSESGREYLANHYPEYRNKFFTSRLGTADHGVNSSKPGEEFRIVSCSNCIPLKRVDLIIRSLMQIDDIEIIWEHYGDGEDYKKLCDLVDTNTMKNIQMRLNGSLSHSELMEIYRTQYYDLFVNVSTTEGVPVSIMEAMSFGIPILATDVGGTGEIVKNGENGVLLPALISEQELAERIRRLCQSRNNELIKMRIRSREIWEDLCDADKNYEAFFSHIRSANNGRSV